MPGVLDLVAVAYKAPAETEAFLMSVAQYLDVPFTLTVVSNDPDVRQICCDGVSHIDENAAYCQEAALIENDENVGYARAVNQGVMAGDAPFIGILNCDVLFTQDSRMAELCARFLEIPQPAVIGPRTTDSQGRITHGGIVRQPNGRDGHRFWLAPDRGQASDRLSVPTVSGATYFTRRSVWDEMTQCPAYMEFTDKAEGAFLPTQHFYEETWYSYHVRAHGYDVQYHGDLHMIHQWHRSSPVGSIRLTDAEVMFRAACAHHQIGLTF